MEVPSLFAFDTLAGRATDVAVLLVLASLAWWIVRRRTARFRAAGGGQRPSARLTSSDLATELGEVASFVQFSAQTCATCPQVHRLLGELAATEPGVAHVDLAVEEHMDLVRRFSVFRTPTVLLLDGTGTVRARMSGTLTRASALAALGELTPRVPRSIDA